MALEGMVFVFTGTLENYTRTDAEDMVLALHGKCCSALNKQVNIVVAGDKPGTKLAKAKSLGIKIMNEEEFEALIDANWEDE